MIVSRGQLIEIGGSFRIPEIMAVSGAILREVGTTNITALRDYERAIGPNTGRAACRSTPATTASAASRSRSTLAELVALGRKHNLPVIDDIGSGAADRLRAASASPASRSSRRSIAAGADLVLFSGDKLLGGPQAGIIAGKQGTDSEDREGPADAGLPARQDDARRPRSDAAALSRPATVRFAKSPRCECSRLRLRSCASAATSFATRLQTVPNLSAEVRDDVSFVGGGSLPDVAVPTTVIALSIAGSITELATRLRTGTPAVVGRVQDGKILLDLRTVFERQEDDLLAAIRAAAHE